MSRSNLTDAIGAIDRCSTDELRQIQALISVRLGESMTRITRRGGGQKVDEGKGSKTPKKGSGTTPRKKGNPQRKSQYATHPAYKAYKAAKEAVERLAKEQNVPFKDVTGRARDVYDEAISNWLQTKSGFRGSEETHKSSGAEPKQNQSVEIFGGGDSPAPKGQSETDTSVPRVPSKKRTRFATGDSPGTTGKYSDPPESWTPAAGEDWNSLPRHVRREVWQTYLSGMETTGTAE